MTIKKTFNNQWAIWVNSNKWVETFNTKEEATQFARANGYRGA